MGDADTIALGNVHVVERTRSGGWRIAHRGNPGSLGHIFPAADWADALFAVFTAGMSPGAADARCRDILYADDWEDDDNCL